MKGQKATPDTLNDVFEGLETNGLAEYDKVLTGYIPGAEALETVEKHIQAMMRRRPGMIYILDREHPRYNVEPCLFHSGNGRYR